MITALIILCILVGFYRWLKADRKYKQARTKALKKPDKPAHEPDDTEYTVRIKKYKKLNRVQWMGSGSWKYWEEDRPEGYIPQTYEYNHQKRDGIDYLVVIEES